MKKLLEELCGTADPLAIVFRAGRVERYHAEGLGIHQSVAEHTFRVVMLLHHLWPDSPRDIILAALYHDVAEGVFGDMPAPVKRMPSFRAAMSDAENDFYQHFGFRSAETLSPIDRHRLKVCDYLELCLTCANLSGVDAERITRKGHEYVIEAASKLSRDDWELIKNFIGETYGPSIGYSGL